eukprot:1939083-Alexandrium_andersonii.AAC.1
MRRARAAERKPQSKRWSREVPQELQAGPRARWPRPENSDCDPQVILRTPVGGGEPAGPRATPAGR